jgi:hypothetical protein
MSSSAEMAKSFYRLPARDVKAAIAGLLQDRELVEMDGGYIRAEDERILSEHEPQEMRFVCAIHRNDCLYRAMEAELKAKLLELSKTSR